MRSIQKPGLEEARRNEILPRLLAARWAPGYPHAVKTAVFIPDAVFQRAERQARCTGKSRSRLYGDALREYLARHPPNKVTEAMNRACAEVGEGKDPFVSSAARRALGRSEW